MATENRIQKIGFTVALTAIGIVFFFVFRALSPEFEPISFCIGFLAIILCLASGLRPDKIENAVLWYLADFALRLGTGFPIAFSLYSRHPLWFPFALAVVLALAGIPSWFRAKNRRDESRIPPSIGPYQVPTPEGYSDQLLKHYGPGTPTVEKAEFKP